MSRSYRRHPVLTLQSNSRFGARFAKREAAKAVRRADVGDGAEFKKHYDSYNINDYSFRAFREEDLYYFDSGLEIPRHKLLGK